MKMSLLKNKTKNISLDPVEGKILAPMAIILPLSLPSLFPVEKVVRILKICMVKVSL